MAEMRGDRKVYTERVSGSSPLPPTRFFNNLAYIGRSLVCTDVPQKVAASPASFMKLGEYRA